MEQRIDLQRFIQILKHRAVTIIVTTLFITSIAVIASIYFVKSSYEATEYIVVGKEQNENNYTENQELIRILASAVDLIKSPIVLNAVRAELGNQDTLKELEEKISVQNNKDSQIIHIVIKGSDPERSKQMAYAVGNVSVQKLNEILNVKNLKIVSKSETDISVKKVGDPLFNIAIGMFVGLFLGIVLGMVREYLDNSIKDESEVEQLLGLPVLGIVHVKKNQKKLIAYRPIMKQRGDLSARG
ncbi:Wzz/FepE/Etk N-terminal domain-containing protein [Fictibacillus sp. b24]|uniref:YveK family protein n=1 Tax=Fictibacillus sp. b24 TaxID=3055863 RepID=UPI0025A0BB04|nr:Wzz/FepE/Etk N-terminal domain-containing protein [Fictibacillus sp. b24]MDM5314852.1 Wzz/FepE/Etk N-terminal domain-containing protein [Fictibacillus sp. b24]